MRPGGAALILADRWTGQSLYELFAAKQKFLKILCINFLTTIPWESLIGGKGRQSILNGEKWQTSFSDCVNPQETSFL